MAKVLDNPRPTLKDRAAQLGTQVQGSQAWNAVFVPVQSSARAIQTARVTARTSS